MQKAGDGFGTIRDVEQAAFDLLVIILFDETDNVIAARLIARDDMPLVGQYNKKTRGYHPNIRKAVRTGQDIAPIILAVQNVLRKRNLKIR